MNLNIEYAVVQLKDIINLTNLQANYNNIVEDTMKLCINQKVPFKFNCKHERFTVRYHKGVDSD